MIYANHSIDKIIDKNLVIMTTWRKKMTFQPPNSANQIYVWIKLNLSGYPAFVPPNEMTLP
tara:strand:- start:1319 stop:1501 length:183 start_codon:yes stop_codon:yes gene_type:complete